MRNGRLAVLLGCCALALLSTAGASPDLPEEGGRTVVAYVNDDPIFLDELLESLAGGMGDEASGHENPRAALERLINAKLIVQEAREIGLDELDGYTDRTENAHTMLMRNLLFSSVVAGITEPDAAKVDHSYRSSMEQGRMRALAIPEENDAEAFRAGLERGVPFDALADEFVKDGRATEGDTKTFAPLRELHPNVRSALQGLEPGEWTPVVKLPTGWAAVKLLARRLPDDPVKREEVRQAVLTTERQEAVRAYADALKKKYTSIDMKVFESLDFSADGPGIESYAGDTRVVARLDGGEPVRVAEFADEVKSRYFHGVERAAERGTLSRRARAVLEDILDKRVVMLEAERLEIDESSDYRRSMQEIGDGLLFAMFLDRVVDPEIEVTQADLDAYVEEHAREFTFPAMTRLEGLTFASRDAAQSALEKLRGGTDLAWLETNSAGQVPSSENDTLSALRGRLVMVPALPQRLRDAVEATEAGGYALVEGEGDVFHVVAVRDKVPERVRTPDEIRGEIEPRILARKRQQAVETYAARLREASEVKVLAEGPALREAILAEVRTGSS